MAENTPSQHRSITRPFPGFSQVITMPTSKGVVPANNGTSQIVTLDGRTPLTTSLIVAEKFGKNHKNVLRSIQNLGCSEQFSRLNFAPSDYVDSRGKEQPMYAMTHDGFSLLVMGFTGKEAMQWKEKFLSEFNRLRSIVTRVLQQPLDPEWTQARIEGKKVRKTFVEVIHTSLVPKAIEEGSSNSGKLYVSYTNMLIKALFEIDEQPNKNLRDCLSAKQLKIVEMAETLMAEKIERCIEEGMPFRDIYQLCKHWMTDQYVPAMGGKTKVVSTGIVTA